MNDGINSNGKISGASSDFSAGQGSEPVSAVAVGYNFGFIATSKLADIPLECVGAVRFDGKNHSLYKARTYEDSRKVDTLLDQCKEYQVKDYKIEPVIMRGAVEMTVPGFDRERDNLMFGGYTFSCDGKQIPFDFSGIAWDQEQDGDKLRVSFVTGDTPLATDNFLDDYFEKEYQESSLRINDITAKFLASASQIQEFMISLELDGKELCPEEICALGSFAITELSFSDGKQTFPVKEEVLADFNLSLVPTEKTTEMLSEPLEDKVLQAAELVDGILAKDNGSELFWIANIYYSLTECELDPALSEEELLTLTARLHEASGMSTEPFLTAERVDVVRFLLEYGISPNMSPEFTTISAEKARTLLLTCDMEVFVDLVDAVTNDSRLYYAAEEGSFGKGLIDRVNEAISQSLNTGHPDKEPHASDHEHSESTPNKPSLSAKIQSAAARADASAAAQTPPVKTTER